MKNIKEMAVGGSVGAGAIAATPGRLGTYQRRTFGTFLKRFVNKPKRQKYKMKQVVPIKEYYDMTNVVSQLKNIQNSNQSNSDIVTYGVEDDNGNIMKISVRKEQSREFEERLAFEMQDAKDNKIYDKKMDTSLAELLYNLKDEFKIIDVDFPRIPKNAVYNADKVSYGPDSSVAQSNDMIDDSEVDGDIDGMDNPDEMRLEGDMSSGDMSGLEGEDFDDAALEGDSDEEMEDEEGDDESVEDFVDEEPEDNSPEAILQKVMQMLKADAEAKKAQAEAAAEEARAKQAEYAYKAAQTTVAHEEEFAKMELEMEQQKEKEKEAKKLAKYAKHRVRSAHGMQHKPLGLRESLEIDSILESVLNEADQYDTIQSLTKARQMVMQKYAPDQEDSPEMARNKQELLRIELRELATRMQGVKTRMQQNRRMNTNKMMDPKMQQMQNPQQMQKNNFNPLMRNNMR